jgi:FKBP-type peptidyl-prolyl cis-trans isomerase 2
MGKSIKKGDMIHINFIARLINEEGDEEVFDTTLEPIARKNRVYRDDAIYNPLLVVVGQQWVPQGLDKALESLEIGDEKTIEISFDQGYGPHDPAKIKLIHRREFQKEQIQPKIGERVKIGHQMGTVLNTGGGRVRVDFNHLLAGKNLSYEITVMDLIANPTEQIIALIQRRLPGSDLTETVVTFEEASKKVVIELPEKIRFYEYLQFAKSGAANDIHTVIGKYDEIVYLESFDVYRFSELPSLEEE